jgi:cell division protease FtsH
MDFRSILISKDIHGLIDLLKNICKNGQKGYDLNFSGSVIFVLMNLDEAYRISFDVNPDMLPDQFNKITKKLTIVDIKEALQKRFRNEQIARLGNLFMIYPSFTEESFRRIIDMLLNNYAITIQKNFGINIKFDDTLKEVIYKDSVFPTHGTRPIISSVHEIVKTKLPLVVDNLSSNEVSAVDEIIYSYSDNKVKAVSYYEGNEINSFEIDQPLRVHNHRSNSDKDDQACTAVHESGHFVMFAKLYGKMPEKLTSSTVDKDTSGFMLRDYDDSNKSHSKEDLIKNIKIGLAGYVAEKLVFGDKKRTAGASEDLRKATTLASQMVRDFGMGANTIVTTYLTGDRGTEGGMLVNEDSKIAVNAEIRNIINNCVNDIEITFRNEHWKKMLKDSALFLAKETDMPKTKMQELYDAVPDELKIDNDKQFYIDALNKF